MKNSIAVTALVLGAVMSGGNANSQPAASRSSSDVIVADDFESTPVGAVPAGFTKTGEIAVDEGVAHSGKRALKVENSVRGSRFIDLAPEKVAALGGEHWGRLYYKIKTPTPMPTGRLIHMTFVNGKGTSPLANDLIDVRLANLLFYPTGEFHYRYNVQPPRGRREFGAKSATMQKFNGEWELLEWHVDAATQTFEFFVNGKELTEIGLHQGAGNFEDAEIPAAFQTMSVGFTNYQAATDQGFTVWIDDVAFGKKRLGAVPGAQK